MKLFERLLKRVGYVRRSVVKAVRQYAAALTNRLVNDWLTQSVEIDADIRTSIVAVRERARDLVKNNDYARRFVDLVRVNVVGPEGFKLQMNVTEFDTKQKKFVPDKYANDVIEQGWNEWCNTAAMCHVQGLATFREIQDRVIQYACRDGEFIVELIRNRDNKYGLQLNVIPVELLDHQKNEVINTNSVVMGVEKDANGKPVQYWFGKYDPAVRPYAATAKFSSHEPRPADAIVHGFVKDWENQSRGMSWLAPSMIRLRNLQGYEEAAVLNARVSAAKMGFFTRNADGAQYVGDTVDSAGNTISTVEPGKFEELPAGMDFKPWTPEFPAAGHADFVKATLRGVASGFGVSYNLLANDLEGVSYSSIRSALQDERELWKLRQQWFIESFLRPVFSAWLEQALLNKAINLPDSKLEKFDNPVFVGRRWGWVDPQADVEAVKQEIANNLTTLTQALAERGWSLTELLQERKQELELLKEYGVPADAGGILPPNNNGAKP